MRVSSKVLDLKLTYRCNNDCKYCCQDRQLRKVKSDLSLEQILSILDKEKNVSKVVLTGGEATLSENLLEIIRAIKAKGISNIQLQSNAKKLKSKDFLSALIDAGIDSFGISLHGCSQEMHEAFTGTKDSFEDVISALKNIREYANPVALNCVLTKFNIHHLKEIVDFVRENNYASSIQFAFIHITGKAESGISDFVRISEAANEIKQTLSTEQSETIKIITEAIPFCLMEGFEKHVSELYAEYQTISYDYLVRRDFSNLLPAVFKTKGENCTRCLFNSLCDGTWIEYPRFFGYDEFVPVVNFRGKY